MNRRVSVRGGGTGIDPATATHCAQRNAQVVIIGLRANVLEHAAEAIERVFPDAPSAVPWLPAWACLIGWNAIGIR
ncbi:putative 3-oxacyl-ACP reductase [Burkholderia aenigmatica]|uniref:hypothetical protein n=1 Tax=Burkholderia aenigmatica TaxID=2015348 RepID=UPI000F098CA7|nr:hypothetical protein [Burkholderia aenigmatica]AYQ40923.1 hypothetical protein CVS37_23005 [Burkholderia lata]VWC62074.1 putative 3-oxacyl-ACP reductase [Burkholderia aenigmatica]